jgi:hypothetical protein
VFIMKLVKGFIKVSVSSLAVILFISSPAAAPIRG